MGSRTDVEYFIASNWQINQPFTVVILPKRRDLKRRMARRNGIKFTTTYHTINNFIAPLCCRLGSIWLLAQAKLAQQITAPEDALKPPPWEPPGRMLFTREQVLRAVERAKLKIKARREEEYLHWSISKASHDFATFFIQPCGQKIFSKNQEH